MEPVTERGRPSHSNLAGADRGCGGRSKSQSRCGLLEGLFEGANPRPLTCACGPSTGSSQPL